MRVITLRGLGRENEHWSSFLDNLSKQKWCDKISAIDMPGNGRFHKISSPASIAEFAEFLHLEKMREVKSDKVLIIAISMGGMVAIEYANIYPEHVAGLVLINTSSGDLSSPIERLKPNAFLKFFEILKSQNEELREKAILEMVSNNNVRQSEVLSTWIKIAKDRPVSAFNLLKQLIASGTFKAKKKRPSCQTLILTSQGDQMVNFRSSEKLAAEWAAPIEIHASAGHELVLDDENWVIERINSWVEKSF